MRVSEGSNAIDPRYIIFRTIHVLCKEINLWVGQNGRRNVLFGHVLLIAEIRGGGVVHLFYDDVQMIRFS